MNNKMNDRFDFMVFVNVGEIVFSFNRVIDMLFFFFFFLDTMNKGIGIFLEQKISNYKEFLYLFHTFLY